MKKLAILPVVALTVALIAAPVYAAGSDSSTTSPEGNGDLTSVYIDGKDATNDCVLTLDGNSSDPNIQANIDSANSALAKVDNLADLPDSTGTISEELQKALDFYGSTMKPSDLKEFYLFDLSYCPNGVYTEVNGEVTVTMEDFAFDKEFVILVHDENGNFVVVDPSTYEFTSNGEIKFKVPGLSPFLFIYGDRGTIATTTPTPTATAAPTATATPAAKAETKSPQTGESAGIYLLLISAGLAVAGVVCVKRSMKTSEK